MSNARELLLGIFQAALRAGDPEQAVHRSLERAGSQLSLRDFDGGASTLQIPSAGVRIAALGKASLAMARGAAAVLGDALRGGVVVAPRGHAKAEAEAAANLTLIESSHPLPDASSVRGGEALLEAAQLAAKNGELFLVLLSGGASALAEAPVPPLTLEELREMNQLLIGSGAPIEEMNVVRKKLSRIKGGGLAKAAAPSMVVTLALSDVIGAPLEAIGSGPTLFDANRFAEAMKIIDERALASKLPAAVKKIFADALAQEEGLHADAGNKGGRADPGAGNRFILIGNAARSAEAARRESEARGVPAQVIDAELRGDAEAFALSLARDLREKKPGSSPRCLIWAGELTVTLRGKGLGGRNQQLALAMAVALAGQAGISFAALATDGIDGPTTAAGGIVDGGSEAKIRAAGIEPKRALEENNAFPALAAASALVEIGATGTNVNDLFLLYNEA